MEPVTVPLTGSDLRSIADLTDAVDALTGAGGALDLPQMGRIEVLRDSDTEVVGHLVRFDNWYGFKPLEAS